MQSSRVKEQAPKQYNFPSISNKQLLECFNGIGIELEESELQKPNSHVMHKFYTQLTRLVMDFEYGKIGQCDWPQEGKFMQMITEMCDYPELHYDSMPHLLFFKELATLIGSIVGVSDFNMKDLLKPEPLRVRTIMSGLVNFLRYKESIEHIQDEFIKRSDQYTDQINIVAARSDQLREKIAAKKAQIAQEKEAAYLVDQENAKLQQKLEKVKLQGNQAREEYQKLKLQRQNVDANIKDLDMKISTKTSQMKLVQSRIVSNPDQIKQSIVDMKQLVKQLQEAIGALEKHGLQQRQKRDALQSVEVCLIECLELLIKCNEEYQNSQQSAQKYQQLKAMFAQNETSVRDLKNQLHLTQRKEKALTEKIQRLTTSMQEKASKVQQRYDAGQKQYSQFVQNDQTGSQIKDLEMECKSLRDQINSSKYEFDDEIQGMQDQFIEVKEAVTMYISNLKRSMA